MSDASWSLDQYSPGGLVKFGGENPASHELEMEVFGSEATSRETLGSALRQRVNQPINRNVKLAILLSLSSTF